MAHRGILHWIVHPLADLTGKILAFDTASDRDVPAHVAPAGQGYHDDGLVRARRSTGELNAAATHNLTSLKTFYTIATHRPTA